jgi:hypothetical protein
MRVTSQLADVEFRFGRIAREGHHLVMSSAADQPMATKVYVSPRDVLSFLWQFVRSPSALLFVLLFPVHWLGARKEADIPVDPHRPW